MELIALLSIGFSILRPMLGGWHLGLTKKLKMKGKISPFHVIYSAIEITQEE
jgi:hypothetical protein